MSDLPRQTRTIAHDENDPIGANGQPVWECTLWFGGTKSYREVFLVQARTHGGAVLLCRESRIDPMLVKIDPVLRDAE